MFPTRRALSRTIGGRRAARRAEGRAGADPRGARNAARDGKVEEAAEVGKPGTNWKQVTPAHRKKIGPIVAHYMKSAHPFTECVRDNTKRFGPERAKRVCAVVKDMGERTTKWRKGGKVREMESFVVDQVALAEARLSAMDEMLGYGSALSLAEGTPDSAAPVATALSEQAFADFALLMLVGHPLGRLVEEFVFGAEVAGRVPFGRA
jgi:hypothetical protein